MFHHFFFTLEKQCPSNLLHTTKAKNHSYKHCMCSPAENRNCNPVAYLYEESFFVSNKQR